MKPDISVIIPTYKRKDRVINLLDSLVNEKKFILEIIVVEQGERNEDVFRKFATQKKLPIQYIYLSTPSMTHARNVGAKLAKGKYLLFLDDDVEVHPGLLENHIKNFEDPRVAAVCGRCITQGQTIELNRNDTARINWLGLCSDGFSSTIHQSVDTVIGCNMSWRKDIYLALDGVDEQFTGNALREETDLSLRAKKAGYTISFEPKALVEHMVAASGGARKTEGRIQWYFDFFSNETYFFLKNFNELLLPLFLATKIQWALRCMFGIGREVSVRSILTPIAGICDGVRKCANYAYVNRS